RHRAPPRSRSAARSHTFPAKTAGRLSATRLLHSRTLSVMSRPCTASMAPSIATMCSASAASRCWGRRPTSLVVFDRDRNFSSCNGWGYVLARVFPGALMLMDFDEHRLHRKALGVAFKPAPMKAYLGALNERHRAANRAMASVWLRTGRRQQSQVLP